ncbi:MAG: hypothetical protein JO262_17940 [Solirubrobacterales bacterium]|nr:hypothetical protein [Solirubrobacterales bacterium]
MRRDHELPEEVTAAASASELLEFMRAGDFAAYSAHNGPNGTSPGAKEQTIGRRRATSTLGLRRGAAPG